ncbi:MAG TPA: hypothetical protein VHA82_14295 [Ramlibacter sp.]|uniref:ATP-binding protein n=1 Tax=Ramlibacter sp. TaxID=1917967 RepID=UPI002CAE359C|nr:hypothetical protein [Ramlibacter sp.]HVZ44978.1 hypothetical protein [Ramlibacter sp.]
MSSFDPGAARAFSQQQQRTEIRFIAPPPTELDLLDEWLGGPMGIDAGVLRQADAAAWPAPWLWRTLLLSLEIMQGSRLPALELPRIVSLTAVSEAEGKWHAAVLMPFVEYVPRAVGEIVVSGSMRLCHWARSRPVDDASIAQFFEGLEKPILSRIKRMVPGGKSTVPVLRAAHAIGIPFTHLGSGIYQLGWGSSACRVDRSTTGADSAMGARLAQNKVDTARLLKTGGLPAPMHFIVKDAEEALAAARKLGWPVVVKPGDRDRGEGVTVDVADDEALVSAVERANDGSTRNLVIVEQQVPGVCHRLFMLRGQLLYAVKRLPMSVQGDGEASVEQLIHHAVQADRRQPPWRRSGIQPMDPPALAAMAAAGFSPSSVPAQGQRVPLRRIESTADGGVDEDVSAIVHPDNLEIARRASALFDLEVAGIDIICEDISAAWHASRAIINEVNFAPLLGGGDISRSNLGRYLEELLPDQGRIPVELFVGDEAALQSARRRCAELAAAGRRCWITSATQTIDASGREWKMPLDRTRSRVAALLLDREVDAVMAVMSEDEFRRSGPPLPGLEPSTAIEG